MTFNSNIFSLANFKQSRLFLILVFVIHVLGANAQSLIWEQSIGVSSSDLGTDIIQTNNGDFLLFAYAELTGKASQVMVRRSDIDGKIIWTRDYGVALFNERCFGAVEVANGFVLIGEKESAINPEESDVYFLHIGHDGEVLNETTFDNDGATDIGKSIVGTSDGGFAICGSTQVHGEDNDFLLIKTNNQGQLTWLKAYDNLGNNDIAEDLVESADGYILVGGTSEMPTLTTGHIIQSDLNGEPLDTNQLFSISAGGVFLEAIVKDNDNSFLVAGYNPSIVGDGKAEPILYAIDNDLQMNDVMIGGDLGEYRLFDLIKTNKGSFIAAGSFTGHNVGSKTQAYLMKFEFDGSFDNGSIEEGKIGNTFSREINKITETNEDELVAIGQISDGQLVENILFLKTYQNLRFPKKVIQGNVFVDDNCQFDGNERALEDWLITISGQNYERTLTSNEDGFYFARVDSGNYSVKIYPVNSYWDPCRSDLDIDFTNGSDTSEINFPILKLEECAYMRVDLSIPFLEICEDATYTVNYCNSGVIAGEDVSIEVQLDRFLTLNSTSIPFTRIGDLYLFEIGKVNAGDCGSFKIDVTVDCNEPVLRQSHQTIAHIYPDTICAPIDAQWDNSSVQVLGVCENDTIKFSIKNAGTGTLSFGKSALIIEDQVLIDVAPFGPIAPGEIETFPGIVGTGKTYRIIADQAVGHPGFSLPTMSLEGCATDNEIFETGHVTRFEEDDRNSFIDIETTENTTLNETILLGGYPKGINDSVITSKTDLTYHVRFQNMGSDTIQRVVIRDTISRFLDLSSLKPGASSHKYDYQVYQNGVVKFVLDSLNLPGSSVDEKNSVGFVQFKISQKPNNSNGIRILNSAAINVGYEAAQQTNETNHVIGGIEIKDIITTDVGEVYFTNVSIQNYPNPFDDYTIFELEGLDSKFIDFVAFDMSGRILFSKQFQGNKFQINRDDLKTLSGMCFYKMTVDGQVLNTGRFLLTKSR